MFLMFNNSFFKFGVELFVIIMKKVVLFVLWKCINLDIIDSCEFLRIGE